MIGYILLLYLGTYFNLGALWQVICLIGLLIKLVYVALSIIANRY